MALYKLNESSDSLLDSIDLLLNEAYEEEYDDLINQHKSRIEDLEKKLSDTELRIKKSEEELKIAIDSKPRSWLERKLVGFKAKIHKFEMKYNLTKSNKSKTIIKKILSILTRIVKFINDRLIKFTRYVTDKFDKRTKSQRKFDRSMRRANIITARGNMEVDRILANSYKRSINRDKDDIERFKQLKHKSE
jgi:hypothetical protein